MIKNNKPEGYKIPDNYFSSSKEETLKRLDLIDSNDLSTLSVNEKHSKIKILYPIIGIAASLLLLSGILLMGDDNTEPSLTDVDESELLDYLETHIDDYNLEDLEDIDGLGLDNQDVVEDSDYLDILQEVDIDDLYDLM